MAKYKVRSAFVLGAVPYRAGASKPGVMDEFDCDDKKVAQRMIDAGYLHPNKGQKRTPPATTRSKPGQPPKEPPKPAPKETPKPADDKPATDGDAKGQTEDQVNDGQVDGQQSG